MGLKLGAAEVTGLDWECANRVRCVNSASFVELVFHVLLDNLQVHHSPVYVGTVPPWIEVHPRVGDLEVWRPLLLGISAPITLSASSTSAQRNAHLI